MYPALKIGLDVSHRVGVELLPVLSYGDNILLMDNCAVRYLPLLFAEPLLSAKAQDLPRADADQQALRMQFT